MCPSTLDHSRSSCSSNYCNHSHGSSPAEAIEPSLEVVAEPASTTISMRNLKDRIKRLSESIPKDEPQRTESPSPAP